MIVLRDIGRLICPGHTELRELLAGFGAGPILGKIVTDEQGQVIGVITDGDVRRALLRGVALDAPVTSAMNAHPILGRQGEDSQNRSQLAATRSIIPFLPVVDDARRLVSVLVGNARAATPGALIMAGGLGTRLGERTKSTPKPLVEVAGKPMLEHVLASLESARITDIHVAVHYLAEQIVDFVAARDNRAQVRILREESLLGTAGALGLLPADANGPVLVMNADVVSSVDVEAFLDYCDRHDFDAAIAVARHETRIQFGVIRQDANGLLGDIEEKPVLTHLVAAGLYMVGPELRRFVTRGQRIDMPELMKLGRAAGLKIGLFPLHEYWKDVGRPADLAAADREAADLPIRPRR